MFACKVCGKSFETGKKLGGHASSHSANHISKVRLAMPFERLKKDGSRRKRLVLERGHRCESCKLSQWCEQPIPLELDHIDGHPEHNDKSNLRLLCPNCHALTEHWKGRNAGNHSGTERQKTMKKYGSYRNLRSDNSIR